MKFLKILIANILAIYIEYNFKSVLIGTLIGYIILLIIFNIIGS